MYKIAKIGALIFGVLGVLLCLWVMFTSTEITEAKAPNAAMNTMFSVNYALLIVSIIVVAAAVVISLLATPQGLKKALVFTGAFVAILLVSYPLSFLFDFGADTTYRWVSISITATYLLIALSLIAVVWSVARKSLTK